MKSIVLAGATGLVGREILKGLVADPLVTTIHVLGRQALEAPPANPSAAASRSP